MADESEEKGSEAGEKKSSKLKLIIIGVLALILVGGGGAAITLVLVGGGASEETAEVEVEPVVSKPAEAIYTKVRTMEGKPMFVVTLKSDDKRPHYMQLYVEAKSRDQVVADGLKLHMPVIVARLNTFFSTQDFRTLQTIEGKEALREQATEVVREVMQERIGKPGVETLLFTNMVMQ